MSKVWDEYRNLILVLVLFCVSSTCIGLEIDSEILDEDNSKIEAADVTSDNIGNVVVDGILNYTDGTNQLSHNSNNLLINNTDNVVQLEDVEKLMNIMKNLKETSVKQEEEEEQLKIVNEGDTEEAEENLEMKGRFFGGRINDLSKFTDSIQTVMEFIDILKKYNTIICPYFIDFQFDDTRKIVNEILDIAFNKNEQL